MLRATTRSLGIRSQVQMFSTLAGNWELNWSLCGNNFVPSGPTHRNLSVAELLQYAEKKQDIYAVSSAKAPIFQVGTEAFDAKLPSISRKTFDSLLRSVISAIGTSDAFVLDAAVGSHRDNSLSVRFISDDPAAALAARHLFAPVPLRRPFTVENQVVIFSAPEFELEKPSDFGLPGSSFAAFDPMTGEIALLGTHSTETLRAVVHAATTNEFIRKGSLLVEGDAIVARDGHCVVFTGSIPSNVQVDSSALVSPSAHLISEAGLSRVWTGTTSQIEKAKYGDFVEKDESSGVLKATNAARNLFPNVLPAPRFIVLTHHDEKNVLPTLSELSGAQAAFYFVAGGIEGDKPRSKELIQQALFLSSKLSKSSRILLLNTAAANVQEAVNAITANKLTSGSKNAAGLSVLVASDKPATDSDLKAELSRLRKQVESAAFALDEIMAGAPPA